MFISQNEFASGIVSLTVDYGSKRLNLTFSGDGIGMGPGLERPAREQAEQLVHEFVQAFERARASKQIGWIGI